MRGTARLLVPVAAILLAGPVPSGHADLLCPAPQIGVRLIGRYSLGPALEQEHGGVESHRVTVTLDRPDGGSIRVVIITPAVLLAYGGLSYTLVADAPGIGVCVDPAGRPEVYLGDLAIEAAGNALPRVEIEVPAPVQVGPHRCRGTDRAVELPDLPARVVDVAASSNGCRHTLRLGPA